MDSPEKNTYRLPTYEMNNVEGFEEVNIQQKLHIINEKPALERTGSNERFRNDIALHIRRLGLGRPSRRR